MTSTRIILLLILQATLVGCLTTGKAPLVQKLPVDPVLSHTLSCEELVDYPHALVRLHFCKVLAWSGELQMREAQLHSWQQLPVQVAPVLPGTVPVLQWLAQERGFAGATH